MKRLIIQIQPDKISGFSEKDIIKKFESFCFDRRYVSSVEIEKRGDSGKYLYLYCDTTDIPSLLEQINTLLFKDSLVALAVENEAMIICETDDGFEADPVASNKNRGLVLDTFIIQ